jgi:hypothetical protein
LRGRENNHGKSILSIFVTHFGNDEVLECIYIGRRFKNDTERLEKLFEITAKNDRQPHKHSKIVLETAVVMECLTAGTLSSGACVPAMI